MSGSFFLLLIMDQKYLGSLSFIFLNLLLKFLFNLFLYLLSTRLYSFLACIILNLVIRLLFFRNSFLLSAKLLLLFLHSFPNHGLSFNFKCQISMHGYPQAEQFYSCFYYL